MRRTNIAMITPIEAKGTVKMIIDGSALYFVMPKFFEIDEKLIPSTPDFPINSKAFSILSISSNRRLDTIGISLRITLKQNDMHFVKLFFKSIVKLDKFLL